MDDKKYKKLIKKLNSYKRKYRVMREYYSPIELVKIAKKINEAEDKIEEIRQERIKP